ncbi:unnamed protein product [Rotaria socialis]|uniref:RAI1-like domain-containing protein n=1 Tax=Rotaria socialis TaxID=392032 RepID=A0A821L4F1_9BILA|nr:unnamed protein product [Rotaria socialis]CAF4745237.1 unnamed protein product [Rotaria socialis]
MDLSSHERERKLVPRFRRKNHSKNLVDLDDQEAQALIEKDLESHFKWTSDITDDFKYQYDDYQYEESNQQISINDQANVNFLYDIENSSEQLWKNNMENDDNQFTKWTHDQKQNKISFSIETIQHRQQQWGLDDNNQRSMQFNLINPNEQQYKHDIDTNNDISQKRFIGGDEFRNKIKFAVESQDEKLNLFIQDSEDLLLLKIDTNIPSINSTISLPQNPITFHWLEGISQYNISLPVDKYSQEYSPLTEIKLQLDSSSLKSIKWSLDLLKENLIVSYLISLPENEYKQYSLPDQFHLKLSVDDENYKQLFSLIDFSFKQTLSISSNDIKDQLLTIIDSFEIEHNFGHDDQEQSYQWSLKDLKIIILNLSPIEILNLIYSPTDVKQILLENLLIDSDEISARAFRRYRCKHMSIKNDDKDQLDSLEGLKLQFKGNEQIAIGEKHIENDFNEEQIYQDITNCKILLENEHPQSYDAKIDENSSMNQGPCLYRSDYECQPPKTWSRLRREIGYISFDGSLSQPTYYLNKSFKRFVHIPIKRDHCSSNVYNGYSQFIEKIRLNPDNYFRAFDSIDLRPLLHWYSQKQHLFSSTNKNLLEPPTFICRRLVLRTILANLYCDSDPWKLLVVRIKGQFYLALANRQTKSAEDITIDEYSGYKFEALFTSDQPNTTRLTEKIPLEKPQQQFHTVQYWQFGDFNLLYSNEIDGEIANDIQEKPTTTETPQNLKPENETTTTTTTTTVTKETSDKSSEVDWWEEGAPTDIESSSDQIQDKLKEIQINENLQLINDENETVEKKKRNENQIKAGYVEMKCTNKKIFYRDENKLQTLYWWAQMWLANVYTLMIGYKTSNDGTVNQLDFLSTDKLISKFLSKYDLRLKYCFSYLYSFLNLIEKTITIDDPNTIHAFAYIPQPLEIDPLTGKPLQYDLPKCVPFRYTQIKRSNQRHSNFMPQWYLENIQRTSPIGGILQDDQLKTVEEEMKKRIGHRGRSSCILKQEKLKKRHK